MKACNDKATEKNVIPTETSKVTGSWLQLKVDEGDKAMLYGEHLQRDPVGPIQLSTPSLTPPEGESFLPNIAYKPVYIRLAASGTSTIASPAMIAYLPSKKRACQPISYKMVKKDFYRAFPEYKATEATTGRILAKEYALLLVGQETYADYGGGGQPMLSVLKGANRFLQTHIMGNPHSSNESSSRSSHFESLARRSALRFLGADPEQYTLIWTANASAALGLVRQHYFEDVKRKGVPTTVVMCEDMHNSVNGIRTVIAQDNTLTKLVTIIVLPVDICTLRIAEKLFYNTARKLELCEREIIFLTAQSNVSGVKHAYASLLRHAKANGWDTVLDAAALLPTTPLDLASHPEIDAIPISWYKIAGQPSFGALLVTNTFYSRLHKSHFAGGSVTLVGNEAVADFGHAEGVDKFHDGSIQYSAFPHLYLALERLERLGLRGRRCTSSSMPDTMAD
ncbi:hypothetical protein QFC22_006000 [Naganishia vaughanmartiniae]|uniref:Uncharacterized protein n=1 Tax=Naganishia vaughanmartiniae TaxID=1424756 RepID=A0ACC2WQK3_9TREE|nr:hypothetical protein QFC22_006000 [Naganishia vaughanmartiniae]